MKLSKRSYGLFYKALMKQEGGGLPGGGTVAVSSDPGVFTPTFGGSNKGSDKKKKKKQPINYSGRILKKIKYDQIL